MQPMMKYLVLMAFFLTIMPVVWSQQLSQVKFAGTASLHSFGFIADQEIIIRISPTGEIIEYGIEFRSIRSDHHYAPKLQPYLGRVDHYGPEADSMINGKIKSIGTTWFTYYGANEVEEKAGKIKTIGRHMIDYYSRFDNEALKGKIKMIGDHSIQYFSSFDDEAIRGKLKSVGSTQIVYFTSFDEKFLKGKLKSIGPVVFHYYSITDRRELWGVMKTPVNRQLINGITYILR